jgi:predicted nucleotide-binding protein
MLTGASIAYGLTEGGYGANEITLTERGRRIVAPTEEGDDVAAKAEAVLQPRVLRDFFQKYNRAKLPRAEIAQNVLVSMGLPKERAERAFQTLEENGRAVGIIQDTKTGPFVALDGRAVAAVAAPVETGGEDVATHGADRADGAEAAQREAPAVLSQEVSLPSRPKQLFVAHGKKHKPLEDLKKILNEFKIPYKVAIDEANKGRPISAKVAELMKECSAGIFIFTKDEQFFVQKDEEHKEIWRPSENVVYELGAASIMWDRKIIIVREDGVNFPSDFSDLGYITFKDGEISTKALDILKELVALELVRFSAA